MAKESFLKILIALGLFVTLIGLVWAFVSVIKAADSALPVIGLGLVTASAVPTWVKLVKYLLK